MARQRKPDSVVLATKRGEDAIFDPPEFEPLDPKAPRGMKGEAKKYWERIVPLLVEKKAAQATDFHALVMLCETWEVYTEVMKELKKHPLDKDFANISEKYFSRLMTLSARFGLTPVDRHRVRVKKEQTQETADDEFLGPLKAVG